MSNIPAGYTCVFEDNFDGQTLNTADWFTRYIYNGPDGPGTCDYLASNNEQQRYRETGNHIFTGLSVQLTALPLADGVYRSGMLRLKHLYNLADPSLSHLFLIRMKPPAGKGSWAAAWLNSDARPDGTTGWPPEVDIAELVYNEAEETHNMYHCSAKAPNGAQNLVGVYAVPGFNWNWNTYWANFNFKDGFHEFGCLYENGRHVTFTLDGEVICKVDYTWCYDDGTPAMPAHLLINQAIGGNWAGKFGIDDAAFPQCLEVDYVRVYQKVDPKASISTVGKNYL